MQVDPSPRDDRRLAGPAGTIHPFHVHGQVRLRQGQLALQQSLVDRAELQHAQAAKVYRARALLGLRKQKLAQGGSHYVVGKGQGSQPGAERRHLRVFGEKPTVVGRNAPFASALVHGPE